MRQAAAGSWKNRTIYQVLTDRFVAPNGSYAEGVSRCNITEQKYCGGTFKELERNLNYIRGMNFGAVWMSPTVANSPGGYHGYWCIPALLAAC